jgi:very-short-patch-repair endonuclease
MSFRSRDLSGIRTRGARSLQFARNLLLLQELIASVGGLCWAFGPTAAALHGLDGFTLQAPFHLVVERGRSVSRVGHVVHRARNLVRLDCTEVDGVPVISATRTLIDLAATETRERLTAALDSALRDRLTSEGFLHRRIVELRRQGRVGLTTLVSILEGNEITRGGHTWLERRFLELTGELGLPKPLTQQVVGRRKNKVIRVDCRFPGTNVVVELLGYSFHRSVMEMHNDAERVNRMILDGLRPMQFTYTAVAGDSTTMMATIREALATTRARVGSWPA